MAQMKASPLAKAHSKSQRLSGTCEAARGAGEFMPARWRWGDALAMAHQALFVSLPVAIFLGIALVVLLLALGQANLAFGAAIFPIKRQGDGRVTFAFDRAPQPRDFL